MQSDLVPCELVPLGGDVVVAALADAHGAQRAQAAHGRLVARAAPAEHRAALAAVVAPLQRREADLPGLTLIATSCNGAWYSQQEEFNSTQF